VAAIIVLVQSIFTIHSKTFDLTKAQKNTISEQTAKVLKNMKNEVDVYYFYSVRARVVQIEDIMSLYTKVSPKFKFQAIDADRNPTLAAKFKVDKYGVIVLSRPDNGSQEKVDTLTEEGVTNGLIRVTRDIKKKIYFTSGHGEPSIDGPKNEKSGYSVLKEELESYNYAVSSIQLFTQQGVPADCFILVIAGAQSDLFDPEVQQINRFLNTGGKVMILDAPMVSNRNLNGLLSTRGVVAQNDIIVDKMGRMFGGDPLMPIISTYDQHEITNSMKMASFMPNTRSFELKGTVPGITISSLAKSNPGSWGETDLNSVRKGSVSQGSGDLPAPLCVGAVISQNNASFKADAQSLTNNTNAEVVIFGSSDFVNNTYLSSSGNRDLILNSFNFMAGEGDAIAIKPKDNSFEPLFLSKVLGRMLFLVPTVFLPLLIAAIGVMVFVRRRMS
jgi:ABC-type uncharacterized transport system involved in gliding motility auxiliary subunit